MRYFRPPFRTELPRNSMQLLVEYRFLGTVMDSILYQTIITAAVSQYCTTCYRNSPMDTGHIRVVKYRENAPHRRPDCYSIGIHRLTFQVRNIHHANTAQLLCGKYSVRNQRIHGFVVILHHTRAQRCGSPRLELR